MLGMLWVSSALAVPFQVMGKGVAVLEVSETTASEAFRLSAKGRYSDVRPQGEILVGNTHLYPEGINIVPVLFHNNYASAFETAEVQLWHQPPLGAIQTTPKLFQKQRLEPVHTHPEQENRHQMGATFVLEGLDLVGKRDHTFYLRVIVANAHQV